MKKVEIKYRSIANEIEKLKIRLEKAESKLAKAEAKVEKLNCRWTKEEMLEWRKTVGTTETGWIVNDADIKKNGAWFDWEMAKDAVEEIKSKIENASDRFEKAEKKVEEYRREVEKIADLKTREELYKLEFEAEKKEWAKDGINLEGRYYGTTPKGSRFYVEGNHGFTKRSRKCFTLTINGETVFTSGEFWLAYSYIKNR